MILQHIALTVLVMAVLFLSVMLGYILQQLTGKDGHTDNEHEEDLDQRIENYIIRNGGNPYR